MKNSTSRGRGISNMKLRLLRVGMVAGTALLVRAISAWGTATNDAGSGAPARHGEPDRCESFDHDHATWTAILGPYVRQGWVDYAGLKGGGGLGLSAYLHALESVCRRQYVPWSREQKLAFWINAYNAYTIRLILDNYPTESIRSIGLLPGAAFHRPFIRMPDLRPGRISLHDIEHQILRKEFREARIHFAIVCASKGCPALRSEAYRADDLDRQLDEAARTFLRDRSKNRFDAPSHTLYLSAIFGWFREDFEGPPETLPAFVAHYADEPTAAAIQAGDVQIEFLDYDWSLNGR